MKREIKRGHFVGVDYHMRLLADRLRVESFRRALEELVRPGMAVADVGTGTGLLAFFAARAGARVVYAIEPVPIIRAASRVAADNGFDCVRFLEADSLSLTLPEPVDLVISECMGNFVITDEMLPVLADLHRHLAPGGKICPARIRLFLAPARLLTFRSVDWWDDPVEGIDFSAMKQAALSRSYVLHAYEEDLLGPPAPFCEIDPLQMTLAQINTLSGEVTLELKEPGPLTGVVGWFDAVLSPGVTLSTAPGIRTHWGHLLFPLRPLPMQPGDRLRFTLRLFTEPDSSDSSWQWRGELLRQDEVIASSAHHTDDPWAPG